MKATITILILALVVFACHRKTVASSDNIAISNKPNNETKISNSEVVSTGQTIYTNRCGRCHGLKKTENYTTQQWNNILKSMIPKAKLNDDEAKQVTSYVMEHAKK
ncbi:MAG TPA: cytochrome c [Flavisolibacter sp.]|jgi:cytochrome c5|nr:cytochrome c [Flavisolibacter sp.]